MGTFLAAVVIGAQALSIWFIYWIWKTKRKTRARAAAGAGAGLADIKNGEVRALATFTGLRGLPWVALANNSLNPVFRIESGQLAYRVIRAQQRPFTDIREVDVREAYGTFNLIFAFRDTPLTFAVNVGTAARGAQALALLPSSVPLTERARSALQAVPASDNAQKPPL
ncbi:hypothetical protein VLK31_09425 [Variovorax sp. H27-G14]|uniref:hypothetical protein n=1 Tax=Variovorax sp. H27-G14 TaxID=3111914 RepID=UPI0038FD3E91